MTDKRAVTRVETVYGEFLYVATDDLSGERFRHMLPLYTRDGRKREDTVAGQRAARRREATMLARGNIKTGDA